MPSFHILPLRECMSEKDKCMRWKVLICGVTMAAALVIIKYYITDYEAAWRKDSQVLKNVKKEKCAETDAPAEEESFAENEGEGTEERSCQNQETEEGEDPKGDLLIRVLIKTDDYAGIFHENPVITCDAGFQVKMEGGLEKLAAGEEYRLGTEAWASISPLQAEGQLVLPELKRSQTHPCYSGCLELQRTEEGVVVINQLPLEEYLPSVLSSEMSSGFPMEALKAQAVCARTYALKKMEENGNTYYGADLDDSVSFQVYNNMEESQETVRAVEETRGQILMEENAIADSLAEVYYYSTSCGVTAEDSFSTEEEFREFITSVRNTDLEAGEPWYRWQAEVSAQKLWENLAEMGCEKQELPSMIKILNREENGRAMQLEVTFPDGTSEMVEGEYDIRRALAPDAGTLILQDGSVCDGLGMLPSGWFVIESTEQMLEDQSRESEMQADSTERISPLVFRLLGGGYGHGNGLSQNGARCMAKQGMKYEEILEFYYPGTKVKEEQEH